MKYVVILCDGMADWQIPELENQTPLAVSHTPHMDGLARRGKMGMVKTVPEGMNPGSDVANLSVLGYDPFVYYSGRSPLEAVSIGVTMSSDDVSFRCNLVTLDPTEGEIPYEARTILDHSADEITTEEAAQLLAAVKPILKEAGDGLHLGVSYRHCYLKEGGKLGTDCTPPHDILGKTIGSYLPKGTYGAQLTQMMKDSYDILKDHPVNQARMARGLKPANSCWFWGEGRKPNLAPFHKLYGLAGAVVCAVDLIRGIALCAGMEHIAVEGATGAIHTNFYGKGQAALQALANGKDFVFVHIESPDECGHKGDAQAKIDSIATIDEKVIGPVLAGLEEMGEAFSILVLPDHPTPVAIRTHTAESVPFVYYRSSMKEGVLQNRVFTEEAAKATGLVLTSGPALLGEFLEK